MKIVFLHPDLGIGGAERLVCDAALALKQKGHQVYFLTTYHDPNHCFPETRDGTFPVTVTSNWFPRSIFGYFRAFCMYTRMILATIYLLFFTKLKYDMVFVDQVSHSIPLLKLFALQKVLFYCHFPDLLLSKPGGLLKQIYRYPLNWLEESSTGCADVVLVNSAFTRRIFAKTFTKLADKDLKILYPALKMENFEAKIQATDRFLIPEGKLIISSVNRYERKKGLAVGLKALKLLKNQYGDKIHFIHAGGYDNQNTENIEHLEELQRIADELGLVEGTGGDFQLVCNLSNDEKIDLLQRSNVNLYTPVGEHFGIVPLESMASSTPVVAMASGGPLETVKDGKTGVLVHAPYSEVEVAKALEQFLVNPSLAFELGKNGKDHVLCNFSHEVFVNQLNSICEGLVDTSKL